MILLNTDHLGFVWDSLTLMYILYFRRIGDIDDPVLEWWKQGLLNVQIHVLWSFKWSKKWYYFTAVIDKE